MNYYKYILTLNQDKISFLPTLNKFLHKLTRSTYEDFNNDKKKVNEFISPYSENNALYNPEFKIDKIVAGIIILNHELSFTNLLKDTNSAIAYRNVKIKKEDLKNILLKLNTESYLKISASSEWVVCKKITPIPLNSKFHLDFEEEVEIIPTLLGYLRINRTTNIRSIGSSIKSFNKFTNGDILRFLSILAINGVIDARLDNELLKLFRISNFGRGEIPMGLENRIIYGMIKCNKLVTRKNMTDIFKLNHKDIESLVYDFNANTELNIEISRGGDIIVDRLPDIPLLTQIQYLSAMHRELLGYFISNENSKYNVIQSIWGIDKHRINMILYELIGLGIISDCKIDKYGIKIHKIIDTVTPKPISEFKDVFDLFIYLKDHDIIKLNTLSAETGINKDELIKLLYRLIGDGYFPYAKFKADIFIRGIIKDVSYIFYCKCNKMMDDKICADCGSRRLLCSVCKGNITDLNKILLCPHCSHPSHSDHIIAWLRIKHMCPICRKLLLPNNLQKEEIL